MVRKSYTVRVDGKAIASYSEFESAGHHGVRGVSHVTQERPEYYAGRSAHALASRTAHEQSLANPHAKITVTRQDGTLAISIGAFVLAALSACGGSSFGPSELSTSSTSSTSAVYAVSPSTSNASSTSSMSAPEASTDDAAMGDAETPDAHTIVADAGDEASEHDAAPDAGERDAGPPDAAPDAAPDAGEHDAAPDAGEHDAAPDVAQAVTLVCKENGLDSNGMLNSACLAGSESFTTVVVAVGASCQVDVGPSGFCSGVGVAVQ